MYRVGILIYDQVEVLDFCGPYEVFRNVTHFIDDQLLEVVTISNSTEAIDAQGLQVIPSYGFSNCPDVNILVVPGGNGRWLVEQEDYLEFVKARYSSLDHFMTVCTGAYIPGKLGLLSNDHDATTHQEGIEFLRELAPEANILPSVRFTHSGNIIMSGGISAGIDAALYLVSQIWGMDVAQKIAIYMEYDWRIQQPNVKDPALKSIF